MPEVGKEGKIQLSLSLIGWGERCLLKKVLLLSSRQTRPIRSRAYLLPTDRKPPSGMLFYTPFSRGSQYPY